MSLESRANFTKTLDVVGFAEDSTTLTPAMQRRIERFVKANKDLTRVTCVGFSDRFGSATSNISLGKARGQAGCLEALQHNNKLKVNAVRGKWDRNAWGLNVRRVKITLAYSENAKFTTSFDFAGGSGEISSHAVKVGETLVLPSATMPDHIFAGWYSHATEGVFIGNPGDPYTPDGNTKIFARWVKVQPVSQAPAPAQAPEPTPTASPTPSPEPEIEISSLSLPINLASSLTSDYIDNCSNLSLEISVLVSGEQAPRSFTAPLDSDCVDPAVQLSDLSGMFVGDEVLITASVSPTLTVTPESDSNFVAQSGSLVAEVTIAEDSVIPIEGRILKPILVDFQPNGWTSIVLYGCAPAVVGVVCNTAQRFSLSGNSSQSFRFNPYQFGADGTFSFGAGIKQTPDNLAFVAGYKVGPGTGLTCQTSRSNTTPIVGNDSNPPLASDFTSSGIRNVWFTGCRLNEGVASATFFHIQGPNLN